MRIIKHISIFAFLCISLFGTSQGLFQCINENGEVIFELAADFVHPFSDGVAVYKRNGLYGYVGLDGKLISAAKYEKASDYSEGVSWVKEPFSTGFILINKNQERLTSKTYEKHGICKEGMCAVYENEKLGFVRITGEETIPCKYIGAPYFSENKACVSLYDSKTEKYGFINPKGEMVIPFSYIQSGYSNFENGEARVKINGKTCLINEKGTVVFTPMLSQNLEGFSSGLSATYTKPNRTGWGFINRKNQWAIQPTYDHATSFKHGYSIVTKDKKKGVIDTLGNLIIPMIYDELYANPHSDGYFVCENSGKRVYLNAKGEKFTDLNIEYLLSSNGHSILPYKSTTGKMGFLNMDGTERIKAQYERANSFSEGKAWVKP